MAYRETLEAFADFLFEKPAAQRCSGVIFVAHYGKAWLQWLLGDSKVTKPELSTAAIE